MPEQSFKILVLTSDFGEGHQQVAESIKLALADQHPEAACSVVNIVARLHPHLHPISRDLFLHGVRKLPALYGYLYRKTYGESKTAHLLSDLTNFALKHLEDLIEEEQPSIVVSTYPFASGAMSQLRAQGRSDLPLVTVITDQTIHHSWVHPHTDLYLVGSKRVQDGLAENGVPLCRIQVTGIPLRPAFEKTYSKTELRRQHEIEPDIPTLLILGGGFGLFGSELFEDIDWEILPFPIQFVVICGRNAKMKSQLEKHFRSAKHRVRVLGYVDNMHEWMAMADLILTKPGGVTTSETMALEVPLLLFKPIPGQEEENLHYLLHAGVADYARTVDDVRNKVQSLLQTPSVLAAMKECARREGHRHAATDAARLILQVAQSAHVRMLAPTKQ